MLNVHQQLIHSITFFTDFNIEKMYNLAEELENFDESKVSGQLVVYNIAKTFNWICLIAYLFIIAFWIYQFLKKEQMVRLLKQLDAIIANKESKM